MTKKESSSIHYQIIILNNQNDKSEKASVAEWSKSTADNYEFSHITWVRATLYTEW